MGWGLNLYKRQKGRDRHREGPHEDRGGDWSHRKLEETRLALPWSLLRGHYSTDALISDFWAPEL